MHGGRQVQARNANHSQTESSLQREEAGMNSARVSLGLNAQHLRVQSTPASDGARQCGPAHTSGRHPDALHAQEVRGLQHHLDRCRGQLDPPAVQRSHKGMQLLLGRVRVHKQLLQLGLGQMGHGPKHVGKVGAVGGKVRRCDVGWEICTARGASALMEPKTVTSQNIMQSKN